MTYLPCKYLVGLNALPSDGRGQVHLCASSFLTASVLLLGICLSKIWSHGRLTLLYAVELPDSIPVFRSTNIWLNVAVHDDLPFLSTSRCRLGSCGIFGRSISDSTNTSSMRSGSASVSTQKDRSARRMPTPCSLTRENVLMPLMLWRQAARQRSNFVRIASSLSPSGALSSMKRVEGMTREASAFPLLLMWGSPLMLSPDACGDTLACRASSSSFSESLRGGAATRGAHSKRATPSLPAASAVGADTLSADFFGDL
mmetsp:Transcript_62254/g.161775  ORF Transcript_62254/g.161775 Transcript_62254/m.161775 type:complete len:257 (-) Transcript_62254:268-1038(-)